MLSPKEEMTPMEKDSPQIGLFLGWYPWPARLGVFSLLVGGGGLLWWAALHAWWNLARNNEEYSHLLLIPLMAVGLMILNHGIIFARVGMAKTGAIPLLAGLALNFAPPLLGLDATPDILLSLRLLGLVSFIAGAFTLCFGLAAAKKAVFPLLFLLLMVPLPAVILNPVISFLQKGSAEGVDLLFRLTGMTFFRDGTLFSIPGMEIEVAPECSSIRSSTALFITAVLASHLFLASWRGRVLLVLAAIPLAVFKNAVRIVTLSWLAVKVNPSWITGSSLHKRGGFVFFGIALLFLGGALALLRLGEKRSKRARNQDLSLAKPPSR